MLSKASVDSGPRCVAILVNRIVMSPYVLATVGTRLWPGPELEYSYENADVRRKHALTHSGIHPR